MKVRLNKFIAMCGVAPRRKAEELILRGKVKVNDAVVRTLSYFVNPETDEVKVGDRVIRPLEKVYLVMNKPPGVVCSVKDPFNPTVISLLPEEIRRAAVYPVGRLDLDSEGLLVITNDGDLTYEITHPKHGINKTYHVLLDRPLSEGDLRRWREGLIYEREVLVPVAVRPLPFEPRGRWVEVVIDEGIKREVRKMAWALGYEVERLIRVAIGRMRLGRLERGSFRVLSGQALRQMIRRGGEV